MPLFDSTLKGRWPALWSAILHQPGELNMQVQYGTFNGFYAMRYSNGKVFYRVNGSFYQALGQENQFKPEN